MIEYLSETKSEIIGGSLGINPIMLQQLINGLHALLEQLSLVEFSPSMPVEQQEELSTLMQSVVMFAGKAIIDITKKESVIATLFIGCKLIISLCVVNCVKILYEYGW
jgi:hypothetical protein